LQNNPAQVYNRKYYWWASFLVAVSDQQDEHPIPKAMVYGAFACKAVHSGDWLEMWF